MPYSMMLDSGHGGSDPGAVYRGRREKDDTLRLTLAVGEILQENGIEVLYTRTTDVYKRQAWQQKNCCFVRLSFTKQQFCLLIIFCLFILNCCNHIYSGLVSSTFEFCA